MNCFGTCQDVETNPYDCGSCFNYCQSGVCQSGQCVCLAGQTSCTPPGGGAATCTSLDSDTSNCGACNKTCPAGDYCANGACSGSCSSPLTTCGTTCTDVQTDPSNCGSCGNACATGDGCNNGSCTCGPPNVLCNDTAVFGEEMCTNLKSDPYNCGGCGVICSESACVNGSCTSG